MIRRLSLQALLMLAGAGVASAGIVIVGTYTGTKAPKGRQFEFRIQDGRARIASEPGQFIFYDHPKRTAYIVDTEKKTSFEIDEARAKQVGTQIAEAQRVMRSKLAEMPPEKRAMVEKMMKEQGAELSPPGGSKPLDFVKTGADKVGAWACDRYVATAGARKVEICSAEADALAIPPGDLDVFEGFLDLSEKMAAEAGGIGAAPAPGVAGLPLLRTETRDGIVADRFVIESITRESIPASDVQVPSGLTAVKPPAPRAP